METQNVDKIVSAILTIIAAIIIMYIILPEGLELNLIFEKVSAADENIGDISRTYNLSRNNGTSFDPEIITAGDNLYAVWTDNTTGNGDIYFKRITDRGR